MRSGDDNFSDEFIHQITHAQSTIATYIRSLLPSYPDHMDILQEVNVTLWRKRKKYRPGTNFKAWAFKIARYHVMYTRRKMAIEGRRLIFDPDIVEALAEAAPYENEEMARKLSALQLCVGEMRDKDSALLRVRYSGSVSIQEYARQHELNPGTIRATLRRLRESLHKCVKNKLRRETWSPHEGTT